MLSFFKQFAERTESSNSSTFFSRWGLNDNFSFDIRSCWISGSSKLINGCNWSCKILAARAIASSGDITPFVSTSKINLS